MADWASAYMWSCRHSYTMKNSNFGENTKIFMTEMNVGRPGPLLNEPGKLEFANENMVDCYIRGNKKACHVIGQVYLFGEAFNQNIVMTEEESSFAKSYQTRLADLINGKTIDLIPYDKDSPMTTFNRINIDGLAVGPSRPTTCAVHDNVFPVLIKMGII